MLSVLKTPKENSLSIELPVTMYDETGNEYTSLPVLSKSITLTKDKPGSAIGNISDCTVSFGTQSYTYDGKSKEPTVTVKSSNTKVAAVNSTSGLVTIKGAGTATITATAAEGKNYKAGSAKYSLTVEAPAAPTPTPKPTVSGFSDVQDPNHAFYKAIYWAADAGITKGYPDGTFGINRNVSRGECMMFLWRLKGTPAPKAVAKSPFTDVPKTYAFYNAILWGSQNRITNGYTSGAKKGTFGINENCTRGAIVTFLYRAK